jgi:ABC-type molybdate transport system substrate-binding protein
MFETTRKTGQLRRLTVCAFALALTLVAGTAAADPLQIYAAGSLAGTMQELIAASGLPADAVAPPVFGPAGLLGQRIAGGEHADLFASADMAQPQRVAGTTHAGLLVPYARNRLCLVTMAAKGITAANMLDRMLDPLLRLATSTPGADPGGDWAEAVFDRADAIHPGAKAALDAKALRLFGGPATMVPTNGHTPGGAILLQDRADAVLYYCSGAADILKEVPGSVSVPLPPALAVEPVNGMLVAPDSPAAMHLALFMLSDPGQAILRKHNFLPVLAAPAAVTIVGPDGSSPLSADALAAIGDTDLTVPGERGGEQHYRGPLLMRVLEQAGAAGGDFHAHVGQSLLVTGTDGYGAVIALGEIDPAFEGKAAILATSRDGKPLAHPRLIVPGDKRLGRSVRDVATIELR